MTTPDWMLEALIANHDLALEPFEASLVQAASIDLRLGAVVRRLKSSVTVVDTRAPLEALSETFEVDSQEGLVLPSGAAAIVQTAELMRIPSDHVALVAQRSSLLRLAVHVSSSVVNPGYEGNLPCLVVNHAPVPVRLYPGTPFCQLLLFPLRAAPRRDYGQRGGRYQGEIDLRASRLHEDVTKWVEPPRLRGPSPSDFSSMERVDDPDKLR